MEFLKPGEPDLICDLWTEITRNLQAEFEAEGWPHLTPLQFVARREVVDYRVMERLRRRVDELVKDKQTAEALKPYYRFLCKRPLSSDDFYPTFNRSERGADRCLGHQGRRAPDRKRLRRQWQGTRSRLHDLRERLRSDERSQSPLGHRRGARSRWSVDLRSLVRRAEDVARHDDARIPESVLHRLHSGRPERVGHRAVRRAGSSHCVRHQRGAAARRRGRRAESESAGRLRAALSTNWRSTFSEFQQQCPPGYFNNEGETKPKWALFRGYGPGWDAFQKLLQDWRDKGDMEGLVLE